MNRRVSIQAPMYALTLEERDRMKRTIQRFPQRTQTIRVYDYLALSRPELAWTVEMTNEVVYVQGAFKQAAMPRPGVDPYFPLSPDSSML